MLEQLSNELNELKKEEKRIKDEMKKKRLEFVKKAESFGFTVIKNKVMTDTKSWALEFDFSYYSRFIGEKGPMYDLLSGAFAISDEVYEKLKAEFLKDADSRDYAYICSQLESITGGDSSYFEGRVDVGRFIVNEDNSLEWSPKKSRHDEQGELTRSSYFTVKQMSTSELADVRYVNKEDVIVS